MTDERSPVGSRTGDDQGDDPLRALLEHLAEAKVRTVAELAAAMDTNEALVQQMLADLARGGYLRQTAFCEAGSSSCAGCSQAGLCRVMHQGRVWALTSKGLRAAGAS